MTHAIPLSEAIAAGSGQKRCHGACACGTLRYLVTLDGEVPTRCICTRCRGLDLQIVTLPRHRFRLVTGADALTEPLDGARTPHHFFCARCGEAGFGYPDGPQGRLVTVNAALLLRGDPNAIAEAGGA